MPNYEVVEGNAVEVAAPAAVTFATACQHCLEDSPVVRTLFSVRELVMGSRPSESDRPREMIAMMRALGWGVLALVPEREIVMGATGPTGPLVKSALAVKNLLDAKIRVEGDRNPP